MSASSSPCRAALCLFILSFFFNDTATTEIYTLSLHDALPISGRDEWVAQAQDTVNGSALRLRRSEEHTSELQSRQYLVCRLLLEKKKQRHTRAHLARRRRLDPLRQHAGVGGARPCGAQRTRFFF